MRQLIYLVVDVVTEVGDVGFVRSKVQKIEDGAGGGLDNHLARSRAGGYDFHLHVLGEWRQPHTMTGLDDEEIVVAMHTRELCVLLEQSLHGGVGDAGVVGEFKDGGLHSGYFLSKSSQIFL